MLPSVNEKSNVNLRDSDEERLFQSFKTYFSCAICLNFIEEPRMTPCGHLFCSECLQRWIQSVYPQTYCPKCRNIFRMDDTILMYLGQAAKSTKRVKQESKKKMSFKNTSFYGYRFCSILLYETDFNDSLSLTSVIAVSLAFTFILYFIFQIFETDIVVI